MVLETKNTMLSKLKTKIGYVHAIKGAVIAFFIFVIAVIAFPGGNRFNDQIEIIFTVTTFLFAIISGFFISRLGDRFNSIRESTASEDANFLTLYQMSRLFGKKFSDKIIDLIDKYYITCFDIELTSTNYTYKKTSKYFSAMWDEIIKIGKNNDSNKHSDLVSLMKDLENNRNTGSAVASEKITMGQWAVLIVLSGIILFCIFYLKVDSFYSQGIVVLLSTVLVLVLLLVRDLHNLKLGGVGLMEESGEEILEAIGKKRYYNYHFISLGHVAIPPHVKSYRVGFHVPADDEKNWKIKEVNIK